MTKQIFKKNQSKNWRITLKSLLISMILSLVFSSVSFAEGGGRYSVEPWSFGLNGDTQWTNSEDPTGANPNYVSAAIAGALDEQFIDHHVKFVIQVGDLTDRAGDDAMYTRADVAQSLYDKRIGFFPLRGNHEEYGYLYGRDPDYNLNIPAYLDAFPQTQGMANTFGAKNFSSPDVYDEDGNLILNKFTGGPILKGLSYSFDYGKRGNNARFVIVDVEATDYKVTNAPVDPTYGQGYFYLGWVVYKYTEDLTGDVLIHDEATDTWSVGTGTIPAGTWFRISHGNPSTNFYGFENGTDPLGYNGWGFNYPIDENTVTAQYDPGGTEYWPGKQQAWISAQLEKSTRCTEHAFVFSHRGLIGGNHVDCFFGPDPTVTPDDQNTFYASLMSNDVRYMISGHDHFYNRALLESPDGLSEVEQLISIGASSKFYSPASLNSFPAGVKDRETQISQEADNNIGYYIYTIDGPRVTVDYYSDAIGNFGDGEYYPDGDPNADPPVPGSLTLPDFDFVKKDTWGYSQNGRQFLIAQGDSYTVVEDSLHKTTAKILAGINNSTATDVTPTVIDDNGTPEDPSDDIILSAPRPLNKTVNTGWVDRSKLYKTCCHKRHGEKECKKYHNCKACNNLKSDILSLWGMSELGAEGLTDEYVLSMSYDVLSIIRDYKAMKDLKNGKFGIATFVKGKWVNAVDENFGGKKKFVVGPYKVKYGLGTYGIDPKTKTAWAVLNYNADFAVAKDIRPAPHTQNHRKIKQFLNYLAKLFR